MFCCFHLPLYQYHRYMMTGLYVLLFFPIWTVAFPYDYIYRINNLYVFKQCKQLQNRNIELEKQNILISILNTNLLFSCVSKVYWMLNHAFLIIYSIHIRSSELCAMGVSQRALCFNVLKPCYTDFLVGGEYLFQ